MSFIIHRIQHFDLRVFVYFLGLLNPISKTIYNKIDEKLQLWVKILDFLMVNVMPVGITFPMLIVTYFAYYTTNLGADAFQLPFFAW